MAWTEEQKEYAQRVAIATLIGGLGGGLVGQFASEPATMGKTALGVALGAGLVGAGYGIYLRSGGAKDAQFAGMRLGSVKRYPHLRLGRVGSRVQRLGTPGCAGCAPNKMSGYEIRRKSMMAGIGALRGTYEVAPGTCGEFA